MQDFMLRTIVALQVLGLRMREERGQTSVEWAGIAFVIVALVAALSGVMGSVASAIGSAISKAVGNLGG